jgi:hypothetical protein
MARAAIEPAATAVRCFVPTADRGGVKLERVAQSTQTMLRFTAVPTRLACSSLFDLANSPRSPVLTTTNGQGLAPCGFLVASLARMLSNSASSTLSALALPTVSFSSMW